MDWISAHWDELLAGLGSLYALVSIIIALTPSTADDQWLRRVTERVSPLLPANVRGTFKLPGKKPTPKGGAS